MMKIKRVKNFNEIKKYERRGKKVTALQDVRKTKH